MPLNNDFVNLRSKRDNDAERLPPRVVVLSGGHDPEFSGKYLLDTNALIYAIDRKLKLPKGHYAVSVITKMELLSWPQLSQEDEQKLRATLSVLPVIELRQSVQESAIKIRRATSLKLPDSIISATAMVGGYVLVTNDEKLQNRHIGEAMGLDALTEMGTDF